MGNKLFVGGLSWDTTDQSLREAFEAFGGVREARVILDRDTGRSRGFGFVTYEQDGAAQEAIAKMNGATLDGRTIRVNEAEERGRGGGGGGGGGRRGGSPSRPEVHTRGRPGGGYRRGSSSDGPGGPGGPGGYRGRDGGGGREGGGGRDGGDRRGPPRGGDRGGYRGGGGGGPGGGPGGGRYGGGGGGGGRDGGGGGGGRFSPPGAGAAANGEQGWDDRARRSEKRGKKRKTPNRPEEDFRSRDVAARRSRRESGRSWRDYDMGEDDWPEDE